MAVMEDGSGSGALQTVENTTKSARVTSTGARGQGYSVGGATGAMAAALGANSTILAMRLNPSATKSAYITRIVLYWGVSTAFTTVTVAGRRLEVQRASTAAASGGTAIATAAKAKSNNSASGFDAAQGGDMRISTTGTLTVAGIVFEALPIATLGVTSEGAINASKTAVFETNDAMANPIVIRPGELLVIRNPVAMDAAGVWNLTVDIDWYEAAEADP